jgi:hypothetical protein
MLDPIKAVREALHAANEDLYTNRNRLRAKEQQLVQSQRLGTAGANRTAELQREIDALQDVIVQNQAALQSLKEDLSNVVGEFVLPQSPQQLASQLDDSLPCLLFPLRLETRFMGAPGNRELWVRVFPDDVAVYTHEKELTWDEADAAVAYWIDIQQALAVEDLSERERLEKGAWRTLVGSYGGTRASWIASELKRSVIEKQGEADFAFLLIQVQIAGILNDPGLNTADRRTAILALLDADHPVAPLIRERISELLQDDDTTEQEILQAVGDGILSYLDFDLEALKPESWSRAPRTEIMPDRLVLIGFTNGVKLEQPFPHAVPNPLILGPNPQALEAELAQQGGDLVVGEDYAWISDFEKAIEMGLGMRLSLPDPFNNQGFDRLMVLGVRVSSEPEDHKVLLEELIDNHHYAPEGMALLRQGTPTNNRSDRRSGFSVDDTEGEASFEVETGRQEVPEAVADLEKTDAQRLAEAWDIELEKLVCLANAGRWEVTQAKVMNKALWPATLGYYLEELLELESATIGWIREFFADYVVARGALPAIRIGNQPYGILVTSAFHKWQINSAIDGEDAAFLRQAHDRLQQVEDQWQALASQVSHVDAGGDSFTHLLNMLGLHATSVDFARRIGNHKPVLWNVAHLQRGTNFTAPEPAGQYFQAINDRGLELQNGLGIELDPRSKIFGILFSAHTSVLNGPLVDDVDQADDEQLSETRELPAKYIVTAEDDNGTADTDNTKNYIGWLMSHNLDSLKQQEFVDQEGSTSIPKALLYRMLHRSLLLSHYHAAINLYEEFDLVDTSVRREMDFTNVEAGRTVTRWEFMEAKANEVMPQVSQADLAIGDFIATPVGLNLPAAFSLREVRECVAQLERLTTAELERLFAEHLDLCSYRLDAWQTALFVKRLENLNQRRDSDASGGRPKRGLHLGAYGWVENLRPAPPPIQVSPDEIPEGLREEGITVVEQAGNGGFIHGPSINHAVAAAVLRNAYLTRADQDNVDHFAVRLTSERVRTAFSFLEGVRNGQDLGALLGFQFERNLHDRYVVDGQALSQFILAFRKQYPLVADRITPDDTSDPISQKEAYQVVDGYALLEAVFLADPPLPYPYGVEGLPPDPDNQARQAIIAEVERLQDVLDAIADLSLAEGVFQVAQGNYDRAGAMLKALAEGNAPPEPEIVRTPRSGAVVNHKLAIHFETVETEPDELPWAGDATRRALAAPGLNKWLGDIIGTPDTILFSISYELDETIIALPLAALELQPVDLVYLIGDEAGVLEGGQQINDLSELESRIDYVYRLTRKADDPDWDHSGRVTIHFMSRAGFPDSSDDNRTFFEMLPLLRTLRHLVTRSRPLGADDYMLQSEQSTDPNADRNPKRWDLGILKETLNEAAAALQLAFEGLLPFIDSAEDGDVDYDLLRSLLKTLSEFGLPDAFPKNALFPASGTEPSEAERLALLQAQQDLIEQALLTYEAGRQRHEQAEQLGVLAEPIPDTIAQLTVEEIARMYQQAASLLLGDAFQLIPAFSFKNGPELQEAHAFYHETVPDGGLMRYTQQRLQEGASSQRIQDWRPLAVDEWLQGMACVREKVSLIDQVGTFQEAFDREELTYQFRPLQLPFDPNAHWIAVEFPEVLPEQVDDPDTFVPEGDFLSIVRQLPAGYAISQPQAGLLIDEWNEVIPSRVETTGIALHYNQPNTEPPQNLLLAVSPVINGTWDWDNLVDTLTDTLDRAKRRAVEPDFLRQTDYAQLLPAILSTFTSYPFGTISTNLSAQAASMTFPQEP